MTKQAQELRSFTLFCLHFLAGRIDSLQTSVQDLRRFLDKRAGECRRLDGSTATKVDPGMLETIHEINGAIPMPSMVPEAYATFLVKLCSDLARACAWGWLSPSAVSEPTGTPIAKLRAYHGQTLEIVALRHRILKAPKARRMRLLELLAALREAMALDEYTRAAKALRKALEKALK